MKLRGAAKSLFWLATAIAIFWYATHFYVSGKMSHWYFYRSTTDGYAIDADWLRDATVEKPMYLAIVRSEEIREPIAVPVKARDILPRGANGVISQKDATSGQRVMLEDNRLKITIPYQIKEQNGFKYGDTFRHKGIQTNPWSGVWNLVVILAMGVSLGLLAEGVTDLMGLEFKKIQHHKAGQ